MPLVHIAASTAVICSRNGSKCFCYGGKFSDFPLCAAPLILQFRHLGLAVESITASFQGNPFHVCVTCETSGGIFWLVMSSTSAG